ncbi:hypothetical protein KUV57_12195 [Epibacterium sp. DP7N7-1]|nr:hypothetical protein [Epibacterium sp. DP7N7-1]
MVMHDCDDTNSPISKDAIIFGIGYLRGPKSTLSFGGEGAKKRITARARAALDELLAAGYAEIAQPRDRIPGREHYRGTIQDPHLGQLAKEVGINVFDRSQSGDLSWTCFEDIPEANACPTL